MWWLDFFLISSGYYYIIMTYEAESYDGMHWMVVWLVSRLSIRFS